MPTTRKRSAAATDTTTINFDALLDPAMVKTAGVSLVVDADGWTHLTAHGLHIETALAVEALLRTVSRGEILADARAEARRVRRRLRKIVVATAVTPRRNLTLVARPRRHTTPKER